MTVATAVAAVVAAAFGILVGDFDPVPSWPAHGYLLALGITSQSVGYLLIQVSLPRLPAVLTSAILLTQPVMTVGFAVLLLNETPSAGQLGGVALVVVGLALATGLVGRLANRTQGAHRAGHRAGRAVRLSGWP